LGQLEEPQRSRRRAGLATTRGVLRPGISCRRTRSRDIRRRHYCGSGRLHAATNGHRGID
ncbi:MAG: hypothetical protein S0880_37085, partial [Actinomycetota bacterium]|nr:hypothetical protein [Actinomycetota bacterium]